MKCRECGIETSDNAAICVGCGVSLRQSAATDSKTPKIAVAALVFGILGFFSLGIGGVLGIAFGIIALLQISKSTGEVPGRKHAIGGVVTGAISIIAVPLVIIPAAVFIPTIAKARSAAQCGRCMSNMKMLGVAMSRYCTDYNGVLPSSALRTHSHKWDKQAFCEFAMESQDSKPTIFQLMSHYIQRDNAMWCPADPVKATGQMRPVSYYYKAAIDLAWFQGQRKTTFFAAPADQIMFWEHNGWHRSPELKGVPDNTKICALYADGHVQTVTVLRSGYSESETSPTPLPESGRGEPAWFNWDIKRNAPAPLEANWNLTKYSDAMTEESE